jgi:hypothetical protein
MSHERLKSAVQVDEQLFRPNFEFQIGNRPLQYRWPKGNF